WFMAIPESAEPEELNQMILIRLHGTIWNHLMFGALYSGWAIQLFMTGDVSTQGLVVAFVGVSAFGIVLCLMHVRGAVVAYLGSALVPLIAFMWMSEETHFRTGAFIVIMVALVFVIVLNRYSRGFARMINQANLVKRQKLEAERLGKANLALANQDSLTGLANRRCFMSTLERRVNDVKSHRISGIAVGILDLDGFKLINDVYGHSAGDKLLVEVGRRLSALQSSRVYISRLGGDEFGIIVSNKMNDSELIEIGELLCDAIKAPFCVSGKKTHLGGSVGFAKWADQSDTGESLFEKADYALYHAKENERGGVIIFAAHHAEIIREVREVDRLMQDADFIDEMSLVFQPIVLPNTATTVGFEALARWNSPLLGNISPDVFIRSAERAGTINKITAFLLEKALGEAKKWPEDLFISFNLSMQDITSSEAMVRLIAIVNSSGFDPKRITFEVTETSIMDNYDTALLSLSLLKNMGCKIALDDFGTGYSSLSYVRALPLDKLKLDRSFITGIENSEDACSIVHTMVEMCQSLRLDCIVEGVETKDQLSILSAMGVKLIQGYYYSRPLCSNDAVDFVLEERRLDEFRESPMTQSDMAVIG
ncbi:MAG TPA: EAL domain-containing protein, partial [Devosia sp.]|nr:EAL domain-containing protein [Devosia sp.]